MFKIFNFHCQVAAVNRSRRILDGLMRARTPTGISGRSYLSPAFQCTEAWKERLADPLIQEVKNPNEFFINMLRQYKSEGIIWALDLDLYVQSLSLDESSLHKNFNSDDMEDLLEKLRKTRQMFEIFPSTQHQILRLLIHKDQNANKDELAERNESVTQISKLDQDSLFRILTQPKKYGVFADQYTTLLLMDRYLKRKDYARSARLASRVMLSESLQFGESATASDRLLTHYILYSCLQAAEQLSQSTSAAGDESGASQDTAAGDDPWKEYEIPEKLYTVKDGEEEPEMIRIDYPKNAFFDDHFDIKEPRSVVGKTLSWLSESLSDSPLHRNCLLLGYAMWQKWDTVEKLAKQMKSDKTPVYKEAMEGVLHHLTLPDAVEGRPGSVQWAIEHRVAEFPVLCGSRYQHLMDVDRNSPDGRVVFADCETLKQTARDALQTLFDDESSTVSGMLGESEQQLLEAVAGLESDVVSQQREVFASWSQYRLQSYDNHVAEKHRKETIAEIEDKKSQLKKKQQLISYFDNEDKMHLILATVGKFDHPFPRPRPLRYSRIKKAKLDDNYIPPSVKSNRN